MENWRLNQCKIFKIWRPKPWKTKCEDQNCILKIIGEPKLQFSQIDIY